MNTSRRSSWILLSISLFAGFVFVSSCSTSKVHKGIQVDHFVSQHQLSVNRNFQEDKIHIHSPHGVATLSTGIAGFVISGKWHSLPAAPRYDNGYIYLTPDSAKRLEEVLVSKNTMQASGNRENRLRVVIDPGHGGKFVGARGINGNFEKELNLQVSRHLKQYLSSRDVAVWMTRNSDREISPNYRQDLQGRVEIAEEKDADLFVSIHANAARSSSAAGFELYLSSDGDRTTTINQLESYSRDDRDWASGRSRSASLEDIARMKYRRNKRHSRQLAEHMRRQMGQVVPTGSRGIREKSLHVLRHAPCPAVLVETGFMTNPRDARLISRSDYQKRLARAIGKSILEYRRKQWAANTNP